ncbi:peptidoglycan DD-metalloendopeptidase family protein [Janthinobacterium sp. PLB04]|uniref:Peptidoglycan DD-metalloendopeptidase family protein n=1 Tax=Janthinobacterium lividum TaxID=29581 RepID=A0AAJ4MXX3_9BURK|nr:MULTISPECIES: peptidoglycan DD-metalloendopeptidase family protein [Janthinobacterium]KAB0327473.1 peptidoglycan DD-metalloendopeptidase family protein [Janthinobacterium lividum]QSX99330.1 peptidoglycan DD-metalloendopeptidase family protein [Janthinobacterium lividum]UGQ39142.1 peptidoglycan DD-metalloendopeptidase family protein [Janthinobacterium sp. PLB04]
MIKKSNILLCGITLAALLSGCGTTGVQAPVVERQPSSSSAAASDPRDRDPAYYTVKRGDTLLRIALEYGQNYRDLVAWNDLSNPNDIKVDQVLRVLPPNGDTGGAQTSAIVMPPVTEVKPAAPVVPKKTGPRGEKRAYSDATLAELRADGGSSDVKPAPAPAAAVATAPAAAAAAPAASAPGDEKISWMWPSEGKVIGTFDEGKNKGVDIAGKAGQQVVAAGAGKVMYAGSGIRGYGNLVIVKHSNSLLSAYAHNRSILVKEGQNVNKGQAIAEMGDSDADRVKLHFEIRQQGKPVDPSKFLPNR